MTMTLLDVLRQTCRELRITPPTEVVCDARIHRYHDPANDKPGDKNAWYKACDNLDGSFGGCVGHWRLNIKANWSSRSRRIFTEEERAEYGRKMAEARKRQEEDRERRHQAARGKANRLWRTIRPANPTHPYLMRKQVKPFGARQMGENLVIDYRSSDGTLETLQFITGDGVKKYLKDGKSGGTYHWIGDTPDHSILLSEGFSTGATLHEASAIPVAVCGCAGNLLAVAVALRQKLPFINIIIAADCDPVGLKAANEAAETVGGSVLAPDFGD